MYPSIYNSIQVIRTTIAKKSPFLRIPAFIFCLFLCQLINLIETVRCWFVKLLNVTCRRTDRQTDGQTPYDSIDRGCIASRGKNARQHVPVYLQQFPGYSNHNCKKIAIFTYPGLHYRAMHMHKRGLCCHPVSDGLPVTFRSCAKTNKDIFEIFSPSGSDTILVFPYQRGCK